MKTICRLFLSAKQTTLQKAYISSSFIIVWFAMLLLAYSCFTNGHVGSIQVAGLCGIKFHVMLQGLWPCLPILVECKVLKRLGLEMMGVHLKAIYLFKSMLLPQIWSENFKLQFSFFSIAVFRLITWVVKELDVICIIRYNYGEGLKCVIMGAFEVLS